MSEPRLYLYRKAGREVWDAEMWLPDGRRRVWRTGIADRAGAERAARVRLEMLVGAPAEHAATGAGGAVAVPAVCICDTGAVDTSGPAEQVEGVALVEAAPVSTTLDGAAGGATAAEVGAAVPAQGQGLERAADDARVGVFGRFDRWFFGDLASLWRARA